MNKQQGNKKNSETTNARRYPRVFLARGVHRIAGIEVKWPGEDLTSGVLDISYIGAAIVKTSKITQKYAKGDFVNFQFSFANGDSDIPFQAQVIREDEKSIAVYFPELSLKARKALEGFLKLKLIGLNTKLVDSKYYTKEQDFNYWFHGPNQTNVFIWGNFEKIEKATFELNYEVMTFKNGKFYLSESSKYLETPTEDYAYRVNNPEARELLRKNATEKVVNEVLSLISQIEDNTGIIKKISDTMIETTEKK